MALLDINWNPDKKQLRGFLLLLILFSLLMAAVVYYRTASSRAATYVVAVGVSLALAGLAIPPLGRCVYVVWMAVAFPIGWTVSHVVLALVYYLLLTPIGLGMRLAGRDPMDRKFDPQAASYWKPRGEGHDLDRYFRQF